MQRRPRIQAAIALGAVLLFGLYRWQVAQSERREEAYFIRLNSAVRQHNQLANQAFYLCDHIALGRALSAAEIRLGLKELRAAVVKFQPLVDQLDTLAREGSRAGFLTTAQASCFSRMVHTYRELIPRMPAYAEREERAVDAAEAGDNAAQAAQAALAEQEDPIVFRLIAEQEATIAACNPAEKPHP